MTFAPGKVQPHAASGASTRDLAEDLRRLRDVYGAVVVVSVLEINELRELRIGALASSLSQLRIRWRHVPVSDGGVPTDSIAWVHAMRQVRAHLEDGETVVVHCKRGLGRTGTFAASVATSFGTEAQEAIREVRDARPGAIENSAQEDFVAQAERLWRAD